MEYNALGHNSKIRLYLREAKDPKRIAKLFKSPDRPTGEAVFQVIDEGICDE